MTRQGDGLGILACLDSSEMAATRRRELDIPRNIAAALGRSAVEAANNGFYFNGAGEKVDWSHLVNAACSAKRSIQPEASLPDFHRIAFPETRVQVTNETKSASPCTRGKLPRVSSIRSFALSFSC
jgi:hypothetical protein